MAGGLKVHAPVLAPDRRVDLPAVSRQELTQVLTKGGLEMGLVNEEVRLFDPHETSALIEPGTGDQTVDVGMKAQLLVPGVEHGGKAAGHGSQTFGRGQLFRERVGDRGKEQVVGVPGVGAKEALPQLGREREGDQEIGSLDELVELTLDPAGRGRAAALRTGLMIAGVPGEMNLVAVPTTIGPPAQRRGAAMSDGPKGATLRRGKRRSRFEKVRQKLTQRPQNRGAGHVL